MHRYGMQHHTTDRIPNTTAEAVAELRQCEHKMVKICSFIQNKIEVDASIIRAFKVYM